MNFDAGRVRSITGPEAVKVKTPVACRARSVDLSEWVRPGVCPGGSPDAAPHTHPSVIGWIVAEAVEVVARATAQDSITSRTIRLLIGTPPGRQSWVNVPPLCPLISRVPTA